MVEEACQKILEWEEGVRFVSVPEEVQEVQDLLVGIAGMQMKKVLELPSWFANIFSSEEPTGTFVFELVFELPPKWEKKVSRAMKRVTRKAKWGW